MNGGHKLIVNNYTWHYLNSAEANPMYEQITQFIEEHICKSVLDIGCGFSRINEFLPNDYTIDGLDSDIDCINYCLENHKGKYIVGDVTSIEKYTELDTHYDAVVLSGILYYFGKGNMPTVEDYVDRIIKLYNPKIVVICEPRPSLVYISPDFTELLDRYAYTAKQLNMNIRMGNRIVYCLHTDKNRPERKIKAEFNADSELYNHTKQSNFDDNRLKYNVYLTNTENISNPRDGELFPKNINNYYYISVAAGFKSLFKAAIDWESSKDFKFMYVDVVPTALDYRMFFDYKLKQNSMLSFNDIYDLYVKEINPKIIPMYGSNDIDIDTTVKKNLIELGIDYEHWQKFITAYSHAEKTYIKLDAVNNVTLLKNTINLYTDDKLKWFWYSNMFDWHQFRFKEQTYYRWVKYLDNNIKGLELNGHTPPFTTS
jgi:SAM-dependent methyltransferase